MQRSKLSVRHVEQVAAHHGRHARVGDERVDRTDGGFHRIQRRRDCPIDLGDVVGHVNRAGHRDSASATAWSSALALRHQRDAPARPMQRLRDPEADPLLPAGDERRPRHAATSASARPPIASATRKRMGRDGQRRVHRRRGGQDARIRDPEIGVVMRPPPGRDHAVLQGPSPCAPCRIGATASCDRTPSTASPGNPARRSAAFSFATSASCAAQFVRVQFSTMSPSFSVTRLSGSGRSSDMT
jgi:hypothetical protein